MVVAVYVDTSAVLRAVLETGLTPEIGERLRAADLLFTSRLSIVEAARAFHRIRTRGAAPEERLADARREVDALWARCTIWELTQKVCDQACQLAPHVELRTLDALHLATYLLVRQKIEHVDMLSADERLLAAIESV